MSPYDDALMLKRALLLCLTMTACSSVKPPTSAPLTGPMSDTTWSAEEQQAVQLINELRTKGTLGGDSSVRAGTCAAQWVPTAALNTSNTARLSADYQAQWLATYGWSAHDQPDPTFPSYVGRTVEARFTVAQRTLGTTVDWTVLMENVAAGQTTPAAAVEAWLRSPAHCAAMMHPAARHIGLSLIAGQSAAARATNWAAVLY